MRLRLINKNFILFLNKNEAFYFFDKSVYSPERPFKYSSYFLFLCWIIIKPIKGVEMWITVFSTLICLKYLRIRRVFSVDNFVVKFSFSPIVHN